MYLLKCSRRVVRQSKKYCLLFSFLLILLVSFVSLSQPLAAQTGGPIIGSITTNQAGYPNGQIPLYEKLEISFAISDTTASNPYFPYDDNTPPGVESGTGITVDALLLAPGEIDWQNAKTLPCFYYQPVEEVGSGDDIALLPIGPPEWQCRFSPDFAGIWQFRIRATDSGGTTETGVETFTAVNSNHKGFIKVSASDSRFFEFSDGTPFVTPLVNVEEGNPFNSLAEIRENITNLGEGGVKFVRWFPTGEGANYFVAPYGDSLRISWVFGSSGTKIDDVDTASGKKFSFHPYYYSVQYIPVVSGSSYRLSFRAKVTGERVLRAHISNIAGGQIDICSTANTNHESQGQTCDHRSDDWQDYSIEVAVPSTTIAPIGMRGLYVSTDADAPFNQSLSGTIRIHSIMLQRDETGSGNWGSNLLTRSDPDTYNYIDQRSAAHLDEIFRLSEQYGVYHKLTLFHKNDAVLNRFQADGSIGDWYDCGWGICPNNFYSASGQASRWYQDAYTRYFIARWSYSPALHSVELANETDLYAESYQAGWDFANTFKQLMPRDVLVSNSFWGYWIGDFWTDAQYGYLLDYADKHWYASPNQTTQELISNTWEDSAAYVRECTLRFDDYRNASNYQKPIVRGEGGVGETNTEPHHPDIANESTGTFYHKKIWAHIGAPWDNCDGEWYPRLFVDDGGQFPNSGNDLFNIFSAYERFMQNEPVNNGHYQKVGTDLTDTQQITLTNSTGNLRAWGILDASSGRTLLWVDNADHTWKNMIDGVPVSPAGGTLTIQGLPQGTYTAEWWDTKSGSVTKTQIYITDNAGNLSFSVSNLEEDVAIKFFQAQYEIDNHTYLPVIFKFLLSTTVSAP